MQPFPQAFSPQTRGPSFDMSGDDFSGTMAPVASSGGLTITFFYDRIRATDPLNPAKPGDWRVVLCVRKRIHGDRLTEAVDIISEDVAHAMYPREFAWFKQNEDVPTNGTPLYELPGVSQSQVALLVIHGIRCVEDLVGMTDDQIGQMSSPDARAVYAVAKRWWATKQNSADLLADAAKAAADKAELDKLRAEQATAARQITDLMAQVDVLRGLAAGQGVAVAAAAPDAGQNGARMVDREDAPDMSEQSGAFLGVQMVSGNDDLADVAEPAPSPLPGLRKR